MNKTKHPIDYIRLLNYISSHNVVMHFKTNNETINFCKRMKEFCVTWFRTSKIIDPSGYDIYCENTCYRIRLINDRYKCFYGNKNFYIAEDYRILEWSDFMSFIPDDLEVGNVVEVDRVDKNEYYIALKTDTESCLSFHRLEDDCVNLLKFFFLKSQISNNWFVKKDGMLDAVITKVYRNFDDFKQRKNEVYNRISYNRISNDGMIYSIGKPDDKNFITISPTNGNSYFDFINTEACTIRIKKDNGFKYDNLIKLNYKNLPEFIDALTDIKNMYEKAGIYEKSKDNEKTKIKRRSRFSMSEQDTEQDKKVCDEEWTF